jgi:hypothetical protein
MNLRKLQLTTLLFFSFLTISNLQAQETNKNLTTRVVGKNTYGKETETTFRNFRVTVGGGYAYRLGTIEKMGDPYLNDFMSSLRHGYNLDLETQYYFKEYWGLGFNTNYIRQSSSDKNLLSRDYGTRGQYEEYNQFFYTGANFTGRLEKEKFGFYGSFGLGPIFHTNSAKVDNSRTVQYNHVTLGSYMSISGEYKASQNIGLGLKLSLLAGVISTDDYGSYDDLQNVSNLMLTGFISFRTSK